MSHCPSPVVSSVVVVLVSLVGLARTAGGQEEARPAARHESFFRGALDLRVSPDGERLVFRSDLDHSGTVRLYLALDEAGLLPPLELSAGLAQGAALAGDVGVGDDGVGDVEADYAFSASGKWLVFRADAERDGAAELYRVSADGSAGPERLAPGGGGAVLDFRLAPLEDRVAYRAEGATAERFELGLWSLTGEGQARVLASEAELGWYAFSPDGRSLVYGRDEGRFAQVISLDGSARRTISVSALRALGMGPGGSLGLLAGPKVMPTPPTYNQGKDKLIGLVPNYTYHAVYGEFSYDGQNLVHAVLAIGSASVIKVVDNVNSVSTTTSIASLGSGILQVAGSFRVTISSTGTDVAAAAIYGNGLGNSLFISSDSGGSWQEVFLPAVNSGGYVYDVFSAVPPGHSFGLIDVDYQPSCFYGADGKLYIYTYQEASAATSDTDRLALVEHVFTPGNLTPASRVIFTVTVGSGCTNTFGRICYINAVPTDTGVLLIEGAGTAWFPGGFYSSAYQPRYAFLPYGSSGSVGSWGFIGEGSGAGSSPQLIRDDEIAVAYMRTNVQEDEEFALMRRKSVSSWGWNYGVSKLALANNTGVYSFQDTHPSTGDPLTSLNTTHLSAAGIGTTDLAPLLGGGVGSRTVRDIAANRHTGSVSVFLFGPPAAVTGFMEMDDVTSVRFVPGNPVTPSQRSFVNDYKAAQAANAGKRLDCNPVGFDVCSRPDGKIATFFTGSLEPNPTGPHEGKAFYQLW